MSQTWNIGDTAEFAKTITDDDVVQFARISGDMNPVHLDEEAARRTRFGGRIVHGSMVASFIGSALAMRLPGPGTVYLGQTVKFTRPVRIGDTITVQLQVTEIVEAKRRMRLATTCRNQHGETVIEGEAQVLLPDTEEAAS